MTNASANSASLLIRADASVAMGTGHVMRCLALAQAWQDEGGSCVFVMAESTPAIEARLSRESILVERLFVEAASAEDAQRIAQIAQRNESRWVVIDGYHFGSCYQAAVKRSAGNSKLLFLDDNGHAEHYYADFVLNQNAHANEDFYFNREPYTRLLLGPRYALLRREFQAWAEWKRSIRPVGDRILIVAGGSDPHDLTRQIIEALEDVREFRMEIIVVVGGSNPHLTAIEDAAAGSRHGIQLCADAEDMPALMAWADLAVSAAGTVCWEFCALALPALVIPIVSNQIAAANSLEHLGAARLFAAGAKLSSPELARAVVNLINSPGERSSLSQRARRLVDTGGAARVAAMLRNGTSDGTEQP